MATPPRRKDPESQQPVSYTQRLQCLPSHPSRHILSPLSATVYRYRILQAEQAIERPYPTQPMLHLDASAQHQTPTPTLSSTHLLH